MSAVTAVYLATCTMPVATADVSVAHSHEPWWLKRGATHLIPAAAAASLTTCPEPVAADRVVGAGVVVAVAAAVAAHCAPTARPDYVADR